MLAGLAAALALVPGIGRSSAARLPQPVRTGKLEVVFTFSGSWHAESDAVPPPSQMATRKYVFDAHWEIQFATDQRYKGSVLTPTTLRDLANRPGSWTYLGLQGHWLSGKATERVDDLRPGISCTENYQRADVSTSHQPAVIGVLAKRVHGLLPTPTDLVVALNVNLFVPNPDPRHITYCDDLHAEWSAAAGTTWGEPIPFKRGTDRIATNEDFMGPDWNNVAFREVNAVYTIPLQTIVETAHAYWRAHLGKSGPNPPLRSFNNAWQATLQVSIRPLLRR